MALDLGYGLLVGLEESTEMLGLTIVIYALLRLLQREHGGVKLTVPGAPAGGSGE